MQKGIELVGGKAHRKEQGIYYTPKYIVDYIVKNTIRESLSNLKEDAIKDFKILDLACGSGSFLISVIGELDNYYIRHLDGYKNLSASRKLDVIKNNLYGVDLDERAIYIAKLSVYLKLIMLSQRPEGGGESLLPELRSNIKIGNSLIEDKSLTKEAFVWHDKFADIFKQGGFDIIVGNPPYDVIYSASKPDEFNYYKKRYTSAEYNPNLFAIFLEKALDLLNDNGHLGFIIPDTLLTNKYFGNIRRKILKECDIIKINDLSSGIFSDAVVDTIILILRKKKTKNHKIEIGYDISSFKNLISGNYKKKHISQSEFEESNNNEFNIYFGSELFKIKEKMLDGSLTLGEISKIYRGIVSWDNKKYVSNKKVDERFERLLIGKDATRYYLKYTGHYIQFDDAGVKTGSDREVYEAKEKLVIALITGGMEYRINATYDDKQFYTLQNYNNLIITNSKFNIKYVLALLNSKLINDYYRLFFNDKAIKRVQLQQLPIKEVSEDKQLELAELATEYMKLSKDFEDSSDGTERWNQLKEEIGVVNKKIDRLVYKIYNITEEEKKLIEGR